MSSRRQREVLLASGCGLLCAGLAPFCVQSGSGFQLVAHGFDEATKTLSLAFAGLGLACATLCSVNTSRVVLRWSLLALSSALVFAVSIGSLCVYTDLTTVDLASMVSKSGFSITGELMLEGRVNHLFCMESLHNACEQRTVSQAKAAFPSIQWPSSGDMTVKQACAVEFDTPDVSNVSEGCRMCRQTPVGDGSDLDVVAKHIKPSPTATRWCGEHAGYNRARRSRLDAPYRQHRPELLQDLEVQAGKREANTRLTLLLVLLSLPAITSLLSWLRLIVTMSPVKSLEESHA